MKRYNFDRSHIFTNGKYEEGIFVHAESMHDAYMNAREIAADMSVIAHVGFIDNEPCGKNIVCKYCNPKEKKHGNK